MNGRLNPVDMGRIGGSQGTAAQALARRRNMLKALAKIHPHSPIIHQQLQKIQMEEAEAKRRGSLAGMDLFRG
jgi:hypothetical protein